MVYPFIGVLARGLGVGVGAITTIIAARSSLGLISPVFGAVSDRFGRRIGMLVGLLVFAIGLMLVVFWPTYPMLFAALLLSSVGKYMFDPSVHAYLGDRVAYEKRGLAVAVVEIGWSGAFMLGIPAVGWLIARSGWIAPFPLLAGLAVLMAALLWYTLPGDGTGQAAPLSPLKAVSAIAPHPPAIAGLVLGGLIAASNELVSVVYGDWMETAFGLQVVVLGLATSVIGFAELGGEGLVAVLVDRLGKRRAVGIGLVLNALMAVMLPLLGQRVEGALVGLFLFYITFEFTVVSSIPLMTELVPEARGTLMAGYAAANAGGRAVGALLGQQLFAMGLLANGAGSAALDVLALAALLIFIHPD